jgi:hypothetical protein
VQVTRIRPDETEGPVSIDNIEISDINTASNEIDSGTILGLPDQKSDISWIYIPINKPFEVNNKSWSKIEKLLEEILGSDVVAKSKLIKDDFTEVLQNYIETNPDKFELIWKKIGKVYKNISSDINETSLVIYSGSPDEERYRYRSYFPFNCRPCHYHPRRRTSVGLLVTGDFPFSKVNYIENRLKNFLPLVGLTQIPHHGSGKQFGNPITINAEFAFVQYGTRNSYKHPNYGVIDIYESYGIRVLEVTECEYTKFNEIIERM